MIDDLDMSKHNKNAMQLVSCFYFSKSNSIVPFENVLGEFSNNLVIFNANFHEYKEYLLTSASLIAPLPPCQQVSAFQIPLPPSKMLTYFMDGPFEY